MKKTKVGRLLTIAAVAAALAAFGTTAFAEDLYVRSVNDEDDNTFETICQAINESQNGDTIHVAEGHYRERLYIPSEKSLTIVGEGDAQGVVIQYAEQDSWPEDAVNSYAGVARNPVVLANGALAMSNLTIQGPGAGSAHAEMDGILATSSLTLENVYLNSIRCNSSAYCGAQSGRAIMAEGAGKVSISNCNITNFQKNAIDVNTTGTVNISGNYIQGWDTQSAIGQNGIVIRDGKENTIESNEIKDLIYSNESSGDNHCCAGILVIGDAKATANNNSLSNIDQAFSVTEEAELSGKNNFVEKEYANPVAYINDGLKGYGTLKDAVDAAQNNDSITLIRDTVLDGSVMIDTPKTLTIDGNGNRIIFQWENGVGKNAAFSGVDSNGGEGIAAGSNLTIKNVHFLNSGNYQQGYALLVGHNPIDTKVAFEECQFENFYTAVYVQELMQDSQAKTGAKIDFLNCDFRGCIYYCSIDEVTNGSYVGRSKATFRGGNDGNYYEYNGQMEPWNNIIVDNGNGDVRGFNDWSAAYCIVSGNGATITLNRDVTVAANTLTKPNVYVNKKWHRFEITGEDEPSIGYAYNVEFFDSYGDQQTFVVKSGEKVAKPADPKPETLPQNLVFGGWVVDTWNETTSKYETSPYNFDLPVTNDLYIYAKWEEKTNPVSPSTPTPTPKPSETPDTPTVGKDASGELHVYKNGKVDTSASGLYSDGKDTYYFQKGSLAGDGKFNGLVENTDKKVALIKDSKVDTSVNGLICVDEGDHRLFENGWTDPTSAYKGLYKNTDGNYYYLEKSAVDFGYNGLVLDEKDNFRLVQDGVCYAASTYKGLAKHVDGWYYYIQDGKLNEQFNGLVTDENGDFRLVQNGVCNTTSPYEGLAKHSDGWFYYLKAGKIDMTYTGLVPDGDLNFWYVYKGCVNTTSTEAYAVQHSDGQWYAIQGGKWDKTFTGTLKDWNGAEHSFTGGTAA